MYKIGDVVRVVSEEHIRSHFEHDGVMDGFWTPNGLFISDIMMRLCGNEVTINRVTRNWSHDVIYRIVENDWYWDDCCFEEIEQFDFQGLEELL